MERINIDGKEYVRVGCSRIWYDLELYEQAPPNVLERIHKFLEEQERKREDERQQEQDEEFTAKEIIQSPGVRQLRQEERLQSQAEGEFGARKIQEYGINYLYHITSVNHLSSIFQRGLLSHNEAHRRNLVVRDISMQDVQSIRACKRDPIYKRPLHDYVNLYFSPRNAMLYVRQEIQPSLVILGLDPLLLLRAGTVITDGNSANRPTKFYSSVRDLDKVPWDVIRARYWNDFEDGKRKSCAEVLVYARVDPVSIQRVFLYSETQRSPVLASVGKNPSVVVEPNRQLFF